MALEFTPDQVERIAKAFWGEPNRTLSKKKNELRFGTHGSKSVDLATGRWYDHETSEGGYPFALIKREISGADAQVFQWLESEGIKAGDHNNGHVNGNGVEKKFRIVKTWSYTDEAGEELFQLPPRKWRDRR